MFDRLIDLAIQLALKLRFVTVVDCFEAGCVLRFGHPVRDLAPGLRWLWPLAERPIVVNAMPCAWELEEQTLQTSDRQTILISLIVTIRVVDVRLFELRTMSGYSSVNEAVRGSVSEIVSTMTWEDLRATDWLHELLLPLCRERATPWGVEIQDAATANLTEVTAVRAFGISLEVGE